jgi:hypothetical protein
MEKRRFSFFSILMAAKGSATKKSSSAKIQPAESAEVSLTEMAQPHVLQQKMREKRLTHGETVTASLSPVRLAMAQGRTLMYFCPMRELELLTTINRGDGGDIPGHVTVEGLTVPANLEPGMYTLKNVRLSSNGSIQLSATDKTMWEAYRAAEVPEES